MLKALKEITFPGPWSAFSLLLFTLSFVLIHISPALCSICLALGIVVGILSLASGEIALKNFPVWLYGYPVFFVLQWLLNWYSTGSPASSSNSLLLKLPLVFAPIIYFTGRSVSGLKYWIAIISLILSWLSLAGILNYLAHMDFYNQMVLESKPVPVYSIVYHIEFSLILALVCLVSVIFLFSEQGRELNAFWFWLILFALLVNVAGLHVFAARTGMVALYAGLAVFVIAGGIGQLRRRYVIAAIVLFSIGILFVPSVANRLKNTAGDLNTVIRGKDLNERSFGQRWEAWKMSVVAIKKSPTAGYGLEGARDAVQKEFKLSGSGLEEKNRITPHNQYLETTLQSGLAGGLVLVLTLLFSFFRALKSRNFFVLSTITAIATAMIFESILERQAGVLCFALFVPLLAGLTDSLKIRMNF